MSSIENIYIKVNKALDEKILGCTVSKLKRDEDAKLSISYILHPTIPREFYNDDYHNLEHEVQVDIWSDYDSSNHSTVEKVIKLMEENGFNLVSVRSDMYEPDTNIIHKPILFYYVEKLIKQ